MTVEKLEQLLIEELPPKLANTEADEKVSALANRMLLQIGSVPSLLAFLSDYSIGKTEKNDGSWRIQCEFMRLPKEVLPDLERLLSVDFFKNHRMVQYTKNSQARLGLEIIFKPEDLPGNAYDYSF